MYGPLPLSIALTIPLLLHLLHWIFHIHLRFSSSAPVTKIVLSIPGNMLPIILSTCLLLLTSSVVVGLYEDAPGIAMDYKVHIDAGKEDCYYQLVHPGSTLYVAFQVLRGGDGMAGFAVKNPSGQIVHPYAWKANSDYQETSAVGGYYGVCVDNQFSRFAAKLVNLYITTFRHDEWEKYTKELEALDISVTNFTSALGSVDERIGQMLQHLQYSRTREARDFALIEDNQAYVSFWSALQCVIIMATSSVQVYFVRKLFDTQGGGKMRA